jgi:hypothetical protein
VIAVIREGTWYVLIPGAPAAVNAAFPTLLEMHTAFFVRC